MAEHGEDCQCWMCEDAKFMQGEPAAPAASGQPVCAECGRPESEHSSGREQWCPAAYRPNTYKNRPTAWQPAPPSTARLSYWEAYKNAVHELAEVEQELKTLREALRIIKTDCARALASSEFGPVINYLSLCRNISDRAESALGEKGSK